MKTEKFEKFKVLISQGVKRSEISIKLGISLRTCDNYNKRYREELAKEKQSVKYPFDVNQYFSLMLGSRLPKEKIAQTLGITKKTLIHYEKKYILCNFARKLKLLGYSNMGIKNTLRVKSEAEICSYLDDFVSIDDVINKISILSEYVFLGIENSEELKKGLNDLMLNFSNLKKEIGVQ